MITLTEVSLCAHTFPVALLMRLFGTQVFLSLRCGMWELGWWHSQVREVRAQAHARVRAFPKLSGNGQSRYRGRAWQHEGFAKPSLRQGVFPTYCAVPVLVFITMVTTLHAPASHQPDVKPSSQGLLWGWYIASENDSRNCCIAQLLLARCKIKHTLLVLSWPRLMLLFWGFMSEAQKSWKSLMEKTYEIIPSTHRIVPCKIFSIVLSKAVKICSSEEDPTASPGGLLHLPVCQGGLIHPPSTVQS